MTESEKQAKKKYLAKGKRLTIDFYPSESDLLEHINKQPKKQTYIKDLIRKDMLLIKSAQSIELTTEEQIHLFALAATMEKDRAEAYSEYYKRLIQEQRNKKED